MNQYRLQLLEGIHLDEINFFIPWGANEKETIKKLNAVTVVEEGEKYERDKKNIVITA